MDRTIVRIAPGCAGAGGGPFPGVNDLDAAQHPADGSPRSSAVGRWIGLLGGIEARLAMAAPPQT